MDFKKYFKLRGEIDSKEVLIFSVVGALIFLLIWALLTIGSDPVFPSGILASPGDVFRAFGQLVRENELLRNTTKSLALNFGGYIKAVLWSIPLAFIIGLFPLFRGLNQYIVDSVRFIPLTGLTGIFIVWFGYEGGLKVNFLAFGIFIYLLPTAIVRIDEVKEVYVKTVYTLGANTWQTIKTVFFPAVLSKLSDDIRVLTAISWTYIIVIENVAADGGLGQLIYSSAQRKMKVDKLFALLLLIMVIGLVQDRVFSYLDRKFFPHKYQVKKSYKKSSLKTVATWDIIGEYIVKALGYGFLVIYFVLTLDALFGVLGNLNVLEYFFGDRVWVVHFIAAVIIMLIGRRFVTQQNK